MKTNTEANSAHRSIGMFLIPVRIDTIGAYRNMMVTVLRLVLMTFCS